MLKNLKGYKVSVVSSTESFSGVLNAVDGNWVRLIPFSPDVVNDKLQDLDTGMHVQSVILPVWKDINKIHTIIELDKPDKTYDIENKS